VHEGHAPQFTMFSFVFLRALRGKYANSFPAVPVHKSPDSLLEMSHVEIYEEPETFAAEF